MKKICFSIEKDGFYGTYYECPVKSEYTMIGLFGDDPNDHMAKSGVKWFHRQGVNVMAMSPGKKDYSHVNCPIERVEAAIEKWDVNCRNVISCCCIIYSRDYINNRVDRE